MGSHPIHPPFCHSALAPFGQLLWKPLQRSSYDRSPDHGSFRILVTPMLSRLFLVVGIPNEVWKFGSELGEIAYFYPSVERISFPIFKHHLEGFLKWEYPEYPQIIQVMNDHFKILVLNPIVAWGSPIVRNPQKWRDPPFFGSHLDG